MPTAKREEFHALLMAISNLPPRVKAAAALRPACQLGEVDERILDALMEYGPSLGSEIAEQIGSSFQGLKARLGRLEKHHLVAGVKRTHKSVTRKEWTITDEGRRAAVTPNPEVWQNPA